MPDTGATVQQQPAKPSKLSIHLRNRDCTPCGRVILGRTLQAGAHGEVRVGTALAGSLRGCKVAVKVAHATEEARLRLVQEARILTQVLPPHPNVVGTYNLLKPTVCRATGDVYMPMELCDTDLLMVLLGKPLARSQMRRYARQLVRAVMHCHAHNVFHLDIKPENVFVDLRADSMKLGDFGMAAVLDAAAGGLHSGQHGSASYAAPEVWNSVDEDMEEEEDVGAGGGVGGSSSMNMYDAAKADVWSLGAVLFTMVMRRRPWEDVHVTDKDFAHYLRHGSFRRYSSDPTPEADMMELIMQMMDMNPSRRPSLEAVLKALGEASSSSSKVSTASTTVTAAAASSASSSVGAGDGVGAGPVTEPVSSPVSSPVASPAPSCESPRIDEDEDGSGESPVEEEDDADGDCDMGVDVDDDAVDEDDATPVASIGLDSVSVMLPVDKSMCA